ncbi:hypothetical protein RBS60_02685 [Sinomonas sp. ASV486]|uniref:hypothetical protein n=1 Tax=Sinomonas sp. ASV486 TaxID=3051170 RepID=UPI0027DC4FF7|nr:hypothetical protein [Sinomonas sp. ASV486]MDQ4489103.1 hypothetical protein [Sinomonas sp. ASV486]
MLQDLAPTADAWQQAEGIELLGPVKGSGLNHSTYLVRRSDGQVVQISELLQLIVAKAKRPLDSVELAKRVSEAFGRELDADGLRLLAEGKLEPLGLLMRPGKETTAVPAPKAVPLLALRAKATILPRRAVERLSWVLSPLYSPAVVTMAIASLIALDVWLFMVADAVTALNDVLMTPGMLVALFALMTVGALVHEMGHATACRYGGATPGVIGFGLYVVFPAFYTDVTDAYRLGRAGRIRTDLGGLYFHLLWVIGAGVGFLFTGSPLLLLLVIMTQLQMAQQLPPTIRLDGYFVLADLAGVPDLFARVGPVIRSLIPGRPADPRVLELRPVTRWIVTSWVLIVVPFLGGVLIWLVFSLPFILQQAYAAGSMHAHNLVASAQSGHPLEAILSGIALVMLTLPALGSVLILARAAQSLAVALARRLVPRLPRPLPRHAAPAPAHLHRFGHHS